MPVALFITGMPSASTATLPSASISNRPARLPIRNSNGCGSSLELREEVVGQVELDGGEPLRRADAVQAELGGRELLVHVGDRDQVRAAAARVEIEAVVEELAEGHQEQVIAVRVRRTDRVPARIERLLADHVADQPRIRQRRRAIDGGRADRVGARLRFRLRLELRRRQAEEWLFSGSPRTRGPASSCCRSRSTFRVWRSGSLTCVKRKSRSSDRSWIEVA